MNTEATTVTVQGTPGDDALRAQETQNYRLATFYYYGEAGNDTMWGPGYPHTSHMYGGRGNDVYHLVHDDKAYEKAGEGIDTVTSPYSYSLYGQVIENLRLVDVYDTPATATGNSLRNKIDGNSADNILYGMGGNDTLNGGRGDDILWGGEGNDLFVFDLGYSWEAHNDTIADFEHGKDKIDIPGKFSEYTFIGTERFHNVPREMHVYHLADGNSYISGDTNGDGDADFAIKVLGWHTFSSAEFVL
ncbi:calcium-binding protein [Microvirga tunisiensis]|uniref:calcium-binding protein n=1 Tax=Microvirga tunisiensis TaxID=2108360 RepID=UPI00128CD17C|nr:M10 family metallopeptidase C-terminal domain-containing protein [Microvirga tunisiensis]MPR11986.1 hypothetical protein [Microvirga tunisiensis]